MKGFGAVVRAKRKELGFTLEELSERAGITPNYLGRIENEKVDPSLSIVLGIATALRVGVGDLVDGKVHSTGRRAAPEVIEIANLLDRLPSDVRDTLLPALRKIATRISSSPRPRKR